MEGAGVAWTALPTQAEWLLWVGIMGLSGACLPPSSCCWDQLGVDAEVFVVSAFHLPPTIFMGAK